MTLTDAKSMDFMRYAGCAQASSTPAVDRYFSEKLADCRARGRAARLAASQFIRRADRANGYTS